MQDSIFLDSNILLYAIGNDNYKKSLSIELIKKTPVITVQVLNEISNIMIRKLKLSYQDIHRIIDFIIRKCIIKSIDIITIRKALDISEKYKYSYYDSLIISSALENNCNILYTEDMHHGQNIENILKIINPFLPES
ncbi:MAG: PIN domain-containing protein [Candidatus Eremiobacterota bacterium]